MLTAYRRHKKSCKHTSRRYKGCGCPIWAQGVLHGEEVRRSLDLTNWEAAAKLIREWEIHGQKNTVFLGDAMDRFIKQAEANGLSQDTVQKYRLMKRELTEFFGTAALRSLSLDDLSRYRES